jgi:tRNA(Ile)-lysidine synthase
MRLDRAVAEQRRAVREHLADLPPGSTVLVACSGGPDSLALAAALAFVGPRAGWRSGAVVVDHQLQPGSSEVAVRAAAQCRDLGLDPVEVVAVDVTAVGGPEGAARTARYAALTAASERHAAAALLLGHTMDDQAETVLLGLARGSGARSLAGMADRRGLLRRPFLGARRTATVHACDVLGLRPWQDPTNGPDVDGPLRSRLRHEVLPVLEDVLGPGVVPALARTADQLREDANVLDTLAGQATEGLDVDALADLPTALRRRVLRTALLDAGVPGGSLARTHLAAVDALVTDWHGQAGLDLPGGIHVVRRCGRLTVARG